MPAPRQPYRELGEVTDFAVDRDRAPVLLGYDLVAYGQAKPRALTRRLGGEERLEQFLPVFRRNADAVVAHPDLDAIADFARRDLQHRPERGLSLTAAQASGIETIADEVEEYPGHVLWDDIDWWDIAIKVALQSDVEALILSAGAVIGEVHRLIDERVQIGGLPVAAAAARVLQHAPHNTVGAPAMLGDLFEIAGQHLDRLSNLGALAGVERADRLRRCFLQLVQELDREAGEVVDEVKRVLDLMGDAGGQLTERRHLLRVDQAGLRGLQLTQCRLGRVPRRLDRFLGTFPLGNVCVDQHEAAARHRVPAHLDDPPVRAGALEAHLPAGIFDAAPQFGFELGRTVLAARREIAEILGEARPAGQEGVGQIEHFLEIAVPRREAGLGLEHRDAVSHVVEGDAQLGLSLAQLVRAVA